FHTHAFPDPIAPGAVASLEAEGNVAAVYDGTVSGLIAVMDRSRVDVSVVQPVATKPTQVKRINEWASSANGDRIVAFGAMHPDLDDPATELARMHALGHLPDEEFVSLVRAHGSGRVLFGSDGPWTHPAEEIGHLRRLGLTAGELEGILGGNAERLLAAS
ncbi:MAG: amidohydrolase family protein, partial [Anaerosomatales bacterium]|nr:amidohydrolase family protein [Anaerosomatales bacterium]